MGHVSISAESALRSRSARVGLSSGINACRRMGISAASPLRFAPADFPAQAVRKRRSLTKQEAPTLLRSRHCHTRENSPKRTNTRTMHHVSRVAMDTFPRESTWPAEKKPTMATQVDRVSRWQCRLGYFPGGVDRPCGRNKGVRKVVKQRRFWASVHR